MKLVKGSNPDSVTGVLKYDPAVMFTPSGRAVCSIDLTCGFMLESWGDLAEAMADDKLLSKGAVIHADGVWRTRKWKGKEYRVFVIKQYWVEAWL